MNKTFIAIGCDISKDSIDVFIQHEKGYHVKIKNNQTGFEKLQRKLPKQTDCKICMEATGNYYEEFADYLCEQGYQVYVVNPLKIKWHNKSAFERTKTDKQDAKNIADYCQTRIHKLKPYQPCTPEQYQIKRLISHIKQLNKQLTALKNRIQSNKDDFVTQQLNQQLQDTKAYLKTAKDKLAQISDSPLIKQLVSIPSIGKTTAAVLSHYLTMHKFETKNQFVAFAGLSPQKYQSGETVNQPDKLAIFGNRTLKSLLYMPAVVAYRLGLFKNLVERMKQKGKHGKMIVTAIMRKLAALAFTLHQKGESYNENIKLKT